MQRLTFDASQVDGRLWRYVHAPSTAPADASIYLGFAWALIADRAVYGIPSYYRDAAQRLLERSPQLILWEYAIDPETNDYDGGDIGFVRARTNSPTAPSDLDRAGLFPIESFDDLVRLRSAVRGDASGQVSLFVLHDRAALDPLLAQLRGPTQPRLSQLLGPNDLFIQLTLSEDLGLSTSLGIYAGRDISTEIAALTPTTNSGR